MRFRVAALAGVVLSALSLWWFWPLVSWLQLGTETRTAFTARSPVESIDLPAPPSPSSEIQFGPLSLALPTGEIRNGFCLDEYFSCAFNLHGYSVSFDIDWPKAAEREFVPYEQVLEPFATPAPSVFSSRSANAHAVEVAALFADSTVANLLSTIQVSTFVATDLHGFLAKRSEGGAWADLYPSSGDFHATITVVGRNVDYERALAIIASARLFPKRLAHEQLASDREAINRKWRAGTS
jgi:hypothetical protein